MGARIIGVADAYDGLVSGIEHSPVTPERAVELLCTERRSEFDPRVLNALKILHGQESMPPWTLTKYLDVEPHLSRAL